LIKKIIIAALSCLILFSLTACNPGGNNQESGSKNGTYDQLVKNVNELLSAAALQYDVGLDFESEYVYGLAQAEISSLRLLIDNVLWLKGEGEEISDIIGDAPYSDWDEIVAAGLGSDAPFYFEGLLWKMQGEKEKANELFKKAQANPLHEDRDFYYIKKMSVKDLYELRKEVVELENKIYAAYTPRGVLLTERTGAEFSPAYHLAMASDRAASASQAAQCALNALLCSPYSPALYGNAALYALAAGDIELTAEILSDGLYLAPDDVSINYAAAVVSYAGDDNASAKVYLDKAKANATGDMLARVNELYAKIGG